MTVVYPRFDQTSAGGFDDLDGLLCVQRRLKFKSGRNETMVFAAVSRSLCRPSERNIVNGLNPGVSVVRIV